MGGGEIPLVSGEEMDRVYSLVLLRCTLVFLCLVLELARAKTFERGWLGFAKNLKSESGLAWAKKDFGYLS